MNRKLSNSKINKSQRPSTTLLTDSQKETLEALNAVSEKILIKPDLAGVRRMSRNVERASQWTEKPNEQTGRN